MNTSKQWKEEKMFLLYDERPDVALMNQQKTGLTEIKWNKLYKA